MMHGRGKSDSAIVAEKPTNKAGRPTAELVEPRAGAEGNAVLQSTRRAQDQESVSQALDRIWQVARQRKKEKSMRAKLKEIKEEMRQRSVSRSADEQSRTQAIPRKESRHDLPQPFPLFGDGLSL